MFIDKQSQVFYQQGIYTVLDYLPATPWHRSSQNTWTIYFTSGLLSHRYRTSLSSKEVRGVRDIFVQILPNAPNLSQRSSMLYYLYF